MLAATITIATIWLVPVHYWLSYLLFFSCLFITIHTDFSRMLISTLVTLWAIIPMFICALLGYAPVSFSQAVIAAPILYALLYLLNKAFFYFKHENGLGQGDMDLIAFIGSFLGFMGGWFSLTIGSCMALFAMLAIRIRAPKQKHFPFGPWLASAAIIYALLIHTPYTPSF